MFRYWNLLYFLSSSQYPKFCCSRRLVAMFCRRLHLRFSTLFFFFSLQAFYVSLCRYAPCSKAWPSPRIYWFWFWNRGEVMSFSGFWSVSVGCSGESLGLGPDIWSKMRLSFFYTLHLPSQLGRWGVSVGCSGGSLGQGSRSMCPRWGSLSFTPFIFLLSYGVLRAWIYSNV